MCVCVWQVFLSGFSMLISVLYLCLESGACIASQHGQRYADISVLLNTCDGIAGPNYAVGMHLACVFVYSVLFAPFNALTDVQMMSLEMTKKQKFEALFFSIGSCAALFLFGIKRPNSPLPSFYENIMFLVYGCWGIVFTLEIVHVKEVLISQEERRKEIKGDVEKRVESIKMKLFSRGSAAEGTKSLAAEQVARAQNLTRMNTSPNLLAPYPSLDDFRKEFEKDTLENPVAEAVTRSNRSVSSQVDKVKFGDIEMNGEGGAKKKKKYMQVSALRACAHKRRRPLFKPPPPKCVWLTHVCGCAVPSDHSRFHGGSRWARALPLDPLLCVQVRCRYVRPPRIGTPPRCAAPLCVGHVAALRLVHRLHLHVQVRRHVLGQTRVFPLPWRRHCSVVPHRGVRVL